MLLVRTGFILVSTPLLQRPATNLLNPSLKVRLGHAWISSALTLSRILTQRTFFVEELYRCAAATPSLEWGVNYKKMESCSLFEDKLQLEPSSWTR